MKNSLLRRPRGQDLLEFALTLPILVLLIFGIVDFGRVVYYYSALQNAVREGARYGIVDPGRTGLIEGEVRSYAVGLDQSELSVFDISNDPVDRTLTVWFQYRFIPVTPLIGKLFEPISGPGNQFIILNASSTMHHEY